MKPPRRRNGIKGAKPKAVTVRILETNGRDRELFVRSIIRACLVLPNVRLLQFIR